jgi:valyl-tRNA synthetase
MSKSKGNIIDPLELIDRYGADALRFTLAAMAAQGRDIKLATSRVKGYRNFATKLWNACRFAEMNGCATLPGFEPDAVEETLNRWIGHETARAVGEVTEAIEAFRFNDAASAVYRFVWNVYCDWYVELSKPVLMGPDSPAKTETQAMVAFVRDQILALLHPFMPFLTEELWSVTSEGGVAREGLLALAPWPLLTGLEDEAAEAEVGWVVDVITAIRSVRTEMNVKPAMQIPMVLAGTAAEASERAQRWSDVIKRMAKIADISIADASPAGAVQLLVRGDMVALPLKGIIDLGVEKARLERERAEAEAEINRIDAKLSNPDFIARAAEEVIEADREKREEAVARRAKIVEALERLKQVE